MNKTKVVLELEIEHWSEAERAIWACAILRLTGVDIPAIRSVKVASAVTDGKPVNLDQFGDIILNENGYKVVYHE